MKPLSGVRIVEAGTSLAARHAGRLLAELGADVFMARAGQPRSTADPDLALLQWLDQDKGFLGDTSGPFDLCITDSDGRDGPGDDPEAHVTVAFSWFGEVGPYAGWKGSDAVVQALSGTAFSFGAPEGPPIVAQGFGPSIIAGVTGLIAGLAALIGRRPESAPVRVDVNVLEAALCITETAAIGAAGGGLQSRRLGVNRFFPTYPASAYETAEGWVGVTALTPAQWRALCALLGLGDAVSDPRYATADGRLDHADEIDALLTPAFRARTAREWADAGQAMRIPMTAITHPGDLPDVEHWRQRETFRPLASDPRVRGPRAPFIIRAGGRVERAPQSPAAPTSLRPLEGLRVLDFTMGWSGPLATRHLGDLGADVIKIESLDYPDWWRGWEAATDSDPPAHEIRASFNAVNRNKRDVTIDLRSEQGISQVRRLAGGADVVIENFTTGVLDNFGLGVSELNRLSPGVITISMGAFGASGPLKGYRAYGSTVEQASGLPFVNGEADWKPCLQHVAYGDAVAGLFAAFAAVACRLGRDMHGGASVDLSQVECLFQFAAPAILREQVTGSHVARTGNIRTEGGWAGCLPCEGEDSWLFVEAHDDADWRRMLAVAGAETAGGTLVERNGIPAPAILARIKAWAAKRTAAEAADLLQRAGIAAAPVLPAHVLGSDAHLRQAGYWTEAERRYVGRHLHGNAPYRLNGERVAILRPAPLLGEHSAEILDGPGWLRSDAAEPFPARPGMGGAGMPHDR